MKKDVDRNLKLRDDEGYFKKFYRDYEFSKRFKIRNC